MIKMRIEFYKDQELAEAIKLLETQYQIVDRSRITNSKREYNKMRLIHLELIEK